MKQNAVLLTRTNLFQKIVTFRRVCEIRGEPLPLNGNNVHDLLLKMVQSKKYVPSADWILPRFGDSLCPDKAWAVYKMFVAPDSVNSDDIVLVFLNDDTRKNITRERLFEYIRDMHYFPCQESGDTCSLAMMEIPDLFEHICNTSLPQPHVVQAHLLHQPLQPNTPNSHQNGGCTGPTQSSATQNPGCSTPHCSALQP